MKAVKNLGRKVLNGLGLGAAIQLMVSSQLKEVGWFGSFKKKQAIDRNGLPLPWLSYPFIYFLEQRIHSEMDVFEFGSGNSTLWFSSHVNSVTSVEHDRQWFDSVKSRMPGNVSMIYQNVETGGEYSKMAVSQHKKFDLILVDGRDRVNCIRHSISALKEGGVIVLDNSNVERYKEGIDYLHARGFRSLDFRGMSPGVAITTQTTVFYRNGNCLGI